MQQPMRHFRIANMLPNCLSRLQLYTACANI